MLGAVQLTQGQTTDLLVGRGLEAPVDPGTVDNKVLPNISRECGFSCRKLLFGLL